MHELTIQRPGLDGDGAFIRSKGEVEQVDLTVHLGVYDDIVPQCAVTERQQITGAVLHGCHYTTRVRETNDGRQEAQKFGFVVTVWMTHPFVTWISGVQTFSTGRTTSS